jgi:hypothetical protein
MATPPTLVSSGVVTGSSSWGTDKPKTASIPMLTGDYLVVIGIGADYGGSGDDFSTPTGGGMTYTLRQQEQLTLNSFPWGWTAQTASDQTVDLSVDITTNSPRYGAVWAVWRGSDGYDSSAKANGTGAASISVTTTTDNCGLTMGVGDWNAVDGSSRTYDTINGITPSAGGSGEIAYNRVVGEYTAYGAYWTDAGTAGSKTAGFSAPTSGVKYAGVVIAMKGSAAGNATINASTIAATAAFQTSETQTGSTVSPSTVATAAAFPSATNSTGSTVSPSAIAAVAAFPAATPSTGSTVSPSAIAATAALPAAALSTGSTVAPAVVAAVAAFPAGETQTGSTVSPATVAAVAAFPVIATGATVNASAIAAVAAFPAATVSGAATVTPSVIAAVAAFPAATVQTDAGIVYTRFAGVLTRVNIRGSVRVGGSPVAFS